MATLTLILFLALAAGASAHAEFVSAVPAPNSTVKSEPTMVKAVYSEEVVASGASITVVGPNGAKADVGDGHVDTSDPNRATMLVSLKPGLGAGKYTVHWTTLATDGDSLSDTFTFTVAAAPAAAPAAAARAAAVVAPTSLPKTGGVPVIPAALSGLCLTGLGLALRRRVG